jgi:TonB family protein
VNIWQELGIGPSTDLAEVKRAYAARLRQVHPEDDPEGFQRLREAYEAALASIQPAPSRPPPVVASRPALPPVVTPVPPQDQGGAPPPPAPAAAPGDAAPVDPRRLAYALIRSVMEAPAEQRQDVIRAALNKPGCEALDFQLAAQRAVAHNLLANFDQLRGLIDDFAAYYGWSSNRVAVEQGEQTIAELMARKDARLWREQVEALPAPAGMAGALAMLRRAPSEAAFLEYGKEAGHIDAMRRALKELQQAKPYVLRFETVPASLQWWAEHLAPKPGEAAPSPQIPPRTGQGSRKAASGGFDARIIFYLIMVLAGIGRCSSELGNNSGSTSYSAPSHAAPSLGAPAPLSQQLPPIPPIPSFSEPSTPSGRKPGALATLSPLPAVPDFPKSAVSPPGQAAAPAPALKLAPGGKPLTAEQRALWSGIQARLSQAMRYPPQALNNGEEGTAMVAFELTGDGHIVHPRLLHSSGHQDLDDEALGVFRRIGQDPFKLSPGMVPANGVVAAQMPVQFKLDSAAH